MSFYYNRNIRQSMPNLGEPRPPDGEGQGRRDRGQGRQDQGQTRGQNTGLGQTRRGDLDDLGQTRRPWTQENPGHIRQSMSPDYPEEADDDDIDFTWVDNESRRYNWETHRANDFTATRQEDNPYGWRALGGTRFVPHSAGDLTETVVPRHTRRDEIPRHTRRDDSLRQTRRNEDIRATRAKENGASPPRHQANRGLAATDIHGGLGRDFGGHVNSGFGDTRGADNFAAGDNLGITRRADALGATQYGREMDRGYVDRNAQQPNGRYEKSKSKDKQNKHDKEAARKSKKPTREEVNNRMTGRHLDDINPVYDNRVTLPSTGPEQDLRRSKKEWKKAQKKGGLFSGMFSSFRDEDARSYADRGIGWKTMAANKGLMNNWHGYFGKIRTKWAPSVSEMDATWDQARGCNSNSSNSYSSSEDGSYKPCGLPRGCVIAIGVILGVLLLTAILVPVIILVGAEPADSTKSLQQYDMELKVENYKYSDDLSNTSSDSFRNLSQAFCNEIENQANTDEYKGCIVTEMRNGSVVFVFTIIIQVTHTQLKTSTEVIVMMGLEADGADTQALGDFQVNVQTIVIIESSAIDEDPLPKEVGYGGACSVTADCVSILSSCADSICACNTNRVHNSATDTCEIINCGQLPSVDNADVSSDGTSYGDVLTVKCNTGHVTSGNHANETVTCTTNGTWGVTTKCIPINCTGTIVEDPVVLVDTNTESLDISYGSILEVTCKAGYETNDTVNVTCQVDGTWSESPVCTPVACAPYVAPTDSHKTADTTTGIYGDSISISCDVGYVFENENVTDEICQADMTWTTRVVCIPVVCVDLTIPPNAVNVSGHMDGGVYEDMVVFECNEGYRLEDDSRNTTVTCLANMTWGPAVDCTKIQCETFTTPDKSTLDVEGDRFGDTITIICDPGYDITGNDVITCQSDTTWTTSGTCEPIDCAEFQTPANGVPPAQTNVTFGDAISDVACQSGFILIGELPTHCLADGSWPVLTCMEVNCTEDLTIPNSFVQGANATIVTFECKIGYALSGDGVVQCADTGEWETTSDCTIVDCGDYPDINHANVTLDAGTTYGDSLEVACETGYTLVAGGSGSTVTCQASGNWSHFPICELVDCGVYQLPDNSQIQDDVSETTFGTELTILCNEGYDLQGDSESVVCGQDGDWSTQPTCVIVDCGEPNAATNGTFDVGATTFNTSFDVVCDDGFEISGDATVVCTASGTWTDLPTCTRVSCGDIQLPDEVELVGQDGELFGDEALLECIEGYQTDDVTVLTCQSNGTWSTAPTCTIKDCGGITVSNGTVHVSDTTYNSMATIDCDQGFYILGNVNITCLSTGLWEDIPTCFASDCGTYEPGANSYVEGLTIVCHEGYNLEGTADLICQSNDTWNEVGTCQPVPCTTPDAIDNGDLNPADGASDSYHFGDTLNVQCHDGFETDTMSIQCQSDGTWSDVPVCSRKQCPDFTIDNGHMVGQALNEYVFEDTVNVTCEDGYLINGTDFATFNCGADGQWHGEATCERRSCPDFPTPDQGTIGDQSQDGHVYGDIVNVTCDPGYLINDAESVLIMCGVDGDWENAFICDKRPCPAFEVPVNASIGQQSTEGHVYGDTINVTCENGFHVNDAELNVVTCGADGTWEGEQSCDRLACPSFEVPVNASIGDQSVDGHVYGDTINVTCESGFHVNDVELNVVTCSADGTWEGEKTCDRLACPSVTLPEHGTIGDQSQDGHVYGDTVNVTCNPGYLINDAVSVLIMCGVDGSWENAFTCEKRPCPAFEVPVNASIGQQSTDGHVYGDTINVTCENGFHVNDAELNVVTCGVDGTWEGEQTCERRGCPSYIIPDHGVVDDQSDGHVFGDSLNVTCIDEGYQINQADHAIVTCNAEGQWDANITCDARPCIPFEVPDHATIEDSTDGHVYRDVLEVTCVNGYLIEGTLTPSTNVTCGTDGQWVGDMVCERRSCPQFDVPANSSIGDQGTDGHRYMDNITVVCLEGFNLFGNATVVCEDDGSWAKAPACVKCPNFDIPHGSIESTTEQNASIVCDDGYHLNGPQMVVCQEDGAWTELPECLLNDCGDPPTVDNGVVTLVTNETTFNSTAEISCNDGFTLDGTMETTCLANSSWSWVSDCHVVDCSVYVPPTNVLVTTNTSSTTFNTTLDVSCDTGHVLSNGSATSVTCGNEGLWIGEPECSPVTCTMFDIPQDASVNVTDTMTEFVYQDLIYVECSLGFVRIGDGNVFCESDGTWSAIPTCQPANCSGFEYLNHGIVQPAQELYTYNDIVTLTCGSGFETNSTNVAICTDTGAWNTTLACVKVTCPSYTSPANGAFETISQLYEFGDILNITCDVGYELIGSTSVMCQSNSTWSPSPTCEPIDCQGYTSPSNGAHEGNTTTYGSVVDITCNFGYVLNGSSTATCTETGDWSTGGECLPVDCGVFDTPTNSVQLTQDPSTTYGATVTFECNDGYLTNNETELTCAADGNWTGNPECNPVVCELFTIPGNATFLNSTDSTYTFGDTVTVECENGFIQNGSSDVSCTASGDWTTLPTCTEISCSVFDISNGNVSFDSIYATITCDDKYTLSGDGTVECQSNGAWTNSPECILSGCGAFPVANNMQINNTNSAVFGDVISVECNEGYSLTGSDIVTCLNDSNWSDTVSCDVIDCGMPVANEKYTLTNGNTTYNSTLQAECIPGLSPSDPDLMTLRCDETGNWDGEPKCVITGVITVTQSDTFLLEQEGSVTCAVTNALNWQRLVFSFLSDSGSETFMVYDKLAGSTTYGHDAIATEDGNDLAIKVTFDVLNCSHTGSYSCKLVVYNNETDDEIEGRGEQPQIKPTGVPITCENGYMLNGSSQASCTDNGALNAGGQCDPVDCGEFDTPTNSVLATQNPSTTYGTTVTFECDDGYLTNNETEITCAADGNWTGKPECNPVVCDLFAIPGNATFLNSTDSTYTFGDTVTVECENGFVQNGSSDVSCTASGDWSALPSCSEVSCSVIQISNGNVVYNDSLSATITCDDKYTLSGDATIECQESGEWTNSPECILSGCGAFPVANNMQINNTNSAVFGDVISVECNKGYSLTGSDIVTCLNDSNWSDTVSCDVIDCGMPVANVKYTLTNGNTTYNSTLQAECIPGLSPSDPDLMTLRCDETGNWDGEPQCVIVGSVSLEQTGSFEIGNSASLVCRVTGALDWQTIGFVHIAGADVSELIIGLDNSTGIPQTVTAEGFNADIDISGSDVIMNVTFDDVSCSVTGMYLCTILVGEEEAPIDAETAMTQINLTATPTKPVISGPEELYAGREAEITCVGNVGMSAQGTFGYMALEQQTSGAPEFTPIHSVNGDGCNGTVTLTYKKAFSSDLDVRCGIWRPDNGGLFEYSDMHSIAVKQSYVAFEKTSYVFNIGEPAHLACDVANMPDWEQIVIRQGDNSTIFTINANQANPNVTGDMVTGSGSHWNATDAHVIMEYATVPCLDIGAVMYTCEAKVNGTWTSETTTTTIQKLPDVPILTLSREIIENKWTLGDRVFSCVGDIGSPSGHISVESNINGAWATLFTLDTDNLEMNNNSIGGFITGNSTASNNCSSYTQTLNFAFEKILIEFQAKKLRCVVTPSPDLIDGQIIKSDADTIMVVEENYCNDTTSTFLPHPYFCHLHIQCNDDATMGVPSPCPEDLCANVNSEPVTCNHCANIGGCTVTVPIDPTAERITCSPLTFDEVIGNSVTSGCVLTNVDIITSISVMKDGTTLYSVDNENGHDGALVVSDDIQININISGSSLSLDFDNISCDHEGEYEIVFNNNTRSEMISLSPISEPGVPVLTLPDIQRTDQVMDVTCAGEVGRGAGNTATGRVKLQVKFEGNDDYNTYSTSTSPTCFSEQCTCNQTVSHQLTTSASWNNSLVRCVTMTGSDITTSSTEQQIQLQENLLSFDGGDKTAKIGDSFQLLCTVKEVDSMSTVTISRTSKLNGDDLECSVAGNGTTDCGLDGITLTGLQIDNVIEVTLDMGQLKCHDEGDYTCLDVTEGSKALMQLTLTSDPKVTDVTLPIAKANGTTQWGSNLLQCSAELGYPAGVLRIEYQLQGGSDFVAVTSNAPPSNKLAEDISKANCQTNETVAYDQMTFDTSFNASQFRCSVFADDTSTTPLVSSPVSTMYVFEETICNGDAEYALNPFDCHMYLRCSGGTLSGTTCSQNCPTIFSNGTNVACSAPCDNCS